MSSRRRAAIRAVTALVGCLAAGPGALSIQAPLPSPPPELLERTRGAWIDLYREWVERPDGGAYPVDPGPAFCEGAGGVALVDQNAVAGSLHLFATIRGRGPFAARARVFDRRTGLAAIEVHPDALAGVQCLQPPGVGAPPVVAGDVLYALGPAGAAPAPLRVSGTSADSLTFAGGLQGTFLAGTPLVDGNGLLRGILVAGTSGGRIGRSQATGPLAGLSRRRHASGAIPLEAALALVEQMKKRRQEGEALPPAEPVVRASGEVLPRNLRGAGGVSEEDLALYSAKTGELGVEFLTPASLEAQQALLKFAYAPGRTFFGWPVFVGMWEPMVVVQQSPRLDPAADSLFPKSEGAMAVERGGEAFDPADSFRDCIEEDIALETAPGTYESRKVKGCRTFYLFSPEAFAPGGEVAVRLTPDPSGAGVAVPVRPETQARIAADFSAWRAAVSGEGAAGERTGAPPDAVVEPLPAPAVPYATRSLGNAELRITRPAGCTFVVTRLQRNGEPAIRIPVAQWKKSFLSVTVVPGFLYAGREEVRFEPVLDDKTRQDAFTLPKPSVPASTTASGMLRLKAGGKKRLFFLRLEVTHRFSLGEVFGSTFHDCQTAAGGFAVRLLGDFDQALRAFDEPAILDIKPPEPPREPPASEEFP